MSKTQITPVSLVATVAAVGVMLVYSSSAKGGFGYETTIAGLALLITLFASDEEGYRSTVQGLAFAAVAGFCLMLAAVYPIVLLMQPKSPEQWAAGTWLAGTLLFFAVDRLRASSRESTAMGLTASRVPAGYAPAAPVYQPPMPTSRPTATVMPVAVPQPQPVSQPLYSAPPVHSAPSLYSAPPVAMETPFVDEPPVIDEARTQVYAPPEPPPAPPPIAPIPPGREATIYLNLLGEGLNVLRSVRAEHLGRDYYRIAEEIPPGERWEYSPGQVVRCRKKALSNGKHLVAFEEAPRAQ